MSTANELSCSNCGVSHGSDDIFCENCGYDFITGSLPGPSEQFAPPDAPSTSEVPIDAPPPVVTDPGVPPMPGEEAPTTAPTPLPNQGTVLVDVAIDRNYFDAVVSEGELSFPTTHFVPQRLELAGPEIHIGRTSQGRAIHPDIDVAALTGDPAVSSRHAVLRLDPVGTMSVTDVGSTNGTYIGSFDGSPATPGAATLLTPGDVIYLGAWTSLTVTLAP
ncbi:MAG: FHA domain-containing protein [Actinomycetota bacterium]